jgi:hypothetical protein
MLLTAHLLGDFVFQSDKMVTQKRASFKWVLVHSAIVTLLTLLITISFQPFLYLWIFASHFLIDVFKIRRIGDDLQGFLLDQASHVLMIAAAACIFSNQSSSLTVRHIPFFEKMLVLVSGFVLCICVGCVIVEKLIASHTEDINNSDAGLINGGKLIGKLERAITFVLIMFGQPAAVGFLFAAKSILRFGEVNDQNRRQEAEYIIIGSFASFGWAMFISFSARYFFAL